ncbi:hypothetical protein RN001_010321 [Aquatica leii]|uniref:Codanin-1 C-terminal domain-containing protein n=1 Tax=Aquatica leii TaxID=1421715 RepID=A0AAN7SQ96_9COLE|nr:hypothetical protein RN001_010321 [Aquatica leii]
MCENILTETLNNKIHLNVLLNWLEGVNTEKFHFKEITKWNCDRVDFISFFLNYIHGNLRCDDNEPNEGIAVTPTRPILFENNSNFVSPLYRPKKSTPKTPPSICLGDFLTRKDTKKKVQRNLNENAFNNCVRRINPTNVSQRVSTNLKTDKNSFSFDKDNDDLVNLVDEGLHVISANIDSVTFRERLNILACVYSFLLDNLVVNITSEVYFVITMLLCKNSTLNSKHILNSIHNKVYFAVCVLSKLHEFLKILDKFTMRLLIENNRFEQFAETKLLNKVKHMLETKVEMCLRSDDVQASVYFMCDTDNRSNFPSDSSFRNFRKQRDLFYEILQVWESQHLVHGWSFDAMLGNRIRVLVNMHWEPCNFMHLAKLFKAQLITSVCKDPDSRFIVTSMPNVDAGKLSRLNTRMVGKQNSSGINAVPGFIGHEEFFKDFVLIADSYVFNKHLIDALAIEIIHLNDFPVNAEEFNADECIKRIYLDRLKSLRVLAKFYGFLEALPYKSECNLSQEVVDCQLQIRSKIYTSLDFNEIVLGAVRKKTLMLTIPWLTEYLSMLDAVSLKLKHLQELTQLLLQIYYSSRYDSIIVRLTLGWLFDLPIFSNEVYNKWVTNTLLPEPETNDFYLDKCDIFDHNVSYICCPYLQEIRKILLNDANETNRLVTFKHITPISKIESSSITPSKRTQKQLEKAFFKSQADSVRKTVEFVSERVASGCVKEICYDMVPVHKQTSFAKLKTDFEDLSFIQQIATTSLENLKNDIDCFVKSTTETRISLAMDALLGTVVLKETKALCIAIAVRNSLERVQEWVNTHIEEDIFINYFKTELKKLDPELNPAKSNIFLNLNGTQNHNTNTASGVDLMKKLKELSWKIVAEPETITLINVNQLLGSIQQSFNERSDINNCMVLGINRMLLDFLFLIITHKPEIVTTDFFSSCCLLFKTSSDINDFFETIVSPRNNFLMSKSQNLELSHECLNLLLDTLIEHELLSVESLQDQVTNYCSSDESIVCLQEMLKLRINDDR